MYWWLRGHLALGRRLAESVLDHELPRAFCLALSLRQPRWPSRSTTSPLRSLVVLGARTCGGRPGDHGERGGGPGAGSAAAGDLGTASERFERARPTRNEPAGRASGPGPSRSSGWERSGCSRATPTQLLHRSSKAWTRLARGATGSRPISLSTTSRSWRWVEATTSAPASISRRACSCHGRPATSQIWPTCSTPLPRWRPRGVYERVPSCWVRRRRSARRSVPGVTATTGPTRQRL